MFYRSDFIDDYDYFSDPKTSEKKINNNIPQNPFRLSPHEINLKKGPKTKQRPSHYPTLNNPFERDHKDEIEECPFHKGEINYNSVFKRPKKKINEEKFQNALNEKENKDNIIVHPNINIIICDPNFLKESSNRENIQCIVQSEINKIKEEISSNLKGNKKEQNNISIADLNAAAPITEDISYLNERVQKIRIYDESNKKEKKEKKENEVNSEKIYTNDGNVDIGKYYID